VNNERTEFRDLYYSLDKASQKKIMDKVRTRQFKQGESITTEATPGGSVYYISKGRVEILKSRDGSTDNQVTIAVLETGQVFGQVSTFLGGNHYAGSVALEDSELMEIPQDSFIEICQKEPKIALQIIRDLSNKLVETNNRALGILNTAITENRLQAIGLAASKIIHDIKTPLTVIVLTAQLIEGMFPDSGEYSSGIVKQAKLVDELVRETLDYAKGTASPPNYQTVDLSSFLNDLRDTYGASLRGRDISFSVENKCLGQVVFDESKIRRVVINLVKNSSEALQEKGEIKITASMASSWLQISVEDSGPGVPESIVENLFMPFVSQGKPNGTGLGLAICQKLVDEHNGRLEYKPRKPHGSRFDIRLPQNLK